MQAEGTHTHPPTHTRTHAHTEEQQRVRDTGSRSRDGVDRASEAKMNELYTPAASPSPSVSVCVHDKQPLISCVAMSVEREC